MAQFHRVFNMMDRRTIKAIAEERISEGGEEKDKGEGLKGSSNQSSPFE